MTENTSLHFDWVPPLVADLAAAQVSIVVSSLSLHPPRARRVGNIGQLWQAITDAAARGVAVAFYMTRPTSSHPATSFNAAAAATLHAAGVAVHLLPPARLLHAKTVSIDNQIAWVGSGNWTAAAATHNREAYLRAASPALAVRLAAHWHDTHTEGA